MLFEVAIIQHPTDKEKKNDGAEDKLIFGPVSILADNEQSLYMVLATRDDFPKGVPLKQMEILHRPF